MINIGVGWRDPMFHNGMRWRDRMINALDMIHALKRGGGNP